MVGTIVASGRRGLFAAQDDRGRIIAARAATRRLLHLGQHQPGRYNWFLQGFRPRDSLSAKRSFLLGFGRGGGDRIYQGAESKGTLRNVL